MTLVIFYWLEADNSFHQNSKVDTRFQKSWRLPTGYVHRRYELTAPFLSSLPQLRQRDKEQLKLFQMVSIVLPDNLYLQYF